MHCTNLIRRVFCVNEREENSFCIFFFFFFVMRTFMGFFFFHWSFCSLLGVLPGTGNVASDITLENFASTFFFALALGPCYSSSLLLSSLKVPAVFSCYKKCRSRSDYFYFSRFLCSKAQGDRKQSQVNGALTFRWRSAVHCTLEDRRLHRKGSDRAR